MHAWNVAGRRGKPHVQLGSKPRPQRPWSSSPSKNKVVAIVFIHESKPPFVKLLTGTVIPRDGKLSHNMNLPGSYKTVHGNKSALRITAEEYKACVREAIDHFFPPASSTSGFESQTRAAKRRRRAVSRLTLVHDRLLCYGATPIQLGQGLPDLKTIRLPPRSCDLDPLDYGVFNNAKRATRKQFYQHDDWDGESDFFVQTLKKMKMGNIVKQFPKRVDSCLEANGGHFERLMRKANLH